MWDLTAIGDIAADVVMANPAGPLVPGREVLVEDARLALGGATAILAAASARLGLRVRIIGMVGNDALGRFALDALADAGVDTTLVVVIDGVQTGVTVSLTRTDDRVLVTHAGPIATFSLAYIPPEAWRETRHLHVSSFFLQRALQPDCGTIFLRARANGSTTSLDTGDDPEDAWGSGIWEALAATDIFLPNEREATRLCGTTDPNTALAYLAARVPTVVIKRGAAGAIARTGGEHFAVEAVAVEPRDTTGAGDVFDAGYLWGMLAGLSPRACLRRATAAGALATTWLGGQSAELTAARVHSVLASSE